VLSESMDFMSGLSEKVSPLRHRGNGGGLCTVVFLVHRRRQTVRRLIVWSEGRHRSIAVLIQRDARVSSLFIVDMVFEPGDATFESGASLIYGGLELACVERHVSGLKAHCPALRADRTLEQDVGWFLVKAAHKSFGGSGM